MDIERAKELLSALADGVDPLTGEVLDRDNVCNRPEIIRALHTVLYELDEAAKIDGCSYYGIFGRIILPLMSPALITGAIFSFMWRWDDFMSALLYIDDPYKYPVSLALKLFCDPGSSSDYGAMFAMATLSIIPIVLIFIFFQKYLADGIATSGLKG